jgi:hypothetical protein
MLLEWLRRHDAVFDQQMRKYLFTTGPIAEAGATSMAGRARADGRGRLPTNSRATNTLATNGLPTNGLPTNGPATNGHATNSLAIGSLRATMLATPETE